MALSRKLLTKDVLQTKSNNNGEVITAGDYEQQQDNVTLDPVQLIHVCIQRDSSCVTLNALHLASILKPAVYEFSSAWSTSK